MEAYQFFPIFCALISLSEIFHFSLALDSLLETQSISDGQTLVSPGQSFELGFFSPGNSKNRYLGIWYKKTPDLVTWVANKNDPITGSQGFLTITRNGLILFNHTSRVIWFSNTTKVAESPIAQLLDSGNFVVKDNARVSSDSSESYLWQSFDSPSHTWLPGMKINDDFNKGLTSWKSLDDPSQGDYTCRIENPELPQLVLSMGSIKRFRTGSWNGIGFSGLLPFSNPHFTPKLVFHMDEFEYMYEPESPLVNWRITLNNSGLLQYYVLNNATEWALIYSEPNDLCDNYGQCGANSICRVQKEPICECLRGFTPREPAEWELLNWSGGCRRRLPLNCLNGDGFSKISRVKLPDLLEFRLNKSMSTKDCEKECLKNCSCTAYANSNITGKGHGCLMWFGNLVDIKGYTEENRGQDIYIRLPASELELLRDSKVRKRLAMIIVVSVITGILIVCFVCWCITWKKKRKNKRGMECKEEDIEVPLFDFATLTAATNGFSPENLIGAGGFGSVYKGSLCTGQDIAVKRLSKNSRQGLEEFKNEVVLIAKLQHRNLVRLLGYCIHGEERILVYEFMPNHSLDYFIFDQNRRPSLSWKKRFDIIMGIARGILYLHQDSRLQIIHRDLKTSNILLDQNLNAVISDFGLARTFGGAEVQVRTTRVAGTYGYMSPEYAIDGEFSIKSDAFAFGVLLLEILSGKKNRGFTHPDHHHNLLGHAWLLWKKDRALELIDSCLENSCVPSQVLRCIQLGLLCVQKFPEDRPVMSCVVSMLINEKDKLPEPKQPGFFIERSSNNGESESKSKREESVSENAVTLTVQEGR